MLAQAKPVVRAAITSGTVMTVADIVCQKMQHRNAKPGTAPPLDWNRALRFGAVGLTLHGPYFFWGFGALDKALGPSKGLGTALKKTALGQVTLFPTYVTLFFLYMGVLEGRGVEGGMEKWRSSFASTYASGSVFWPIANVVNFRYVPSTHRVLYVNACGLVWNAFLSWVNSREQAAAGGAAASSTWQEL